MLTATLAKAALSAGAVGVLLTMLRHAGPRASGLAAAVPINSMPALFWLSAEHGGSYAASAAVGSLWGTGLTVLLGLTVARLAQACLAAAAALPRHSVGAPERLPGRAGLLPMAVAGVMSMLVSELSVHGGAQCCGLIAAIPVVGLCALVAGYRQGGTLLMCSVLSGYLDGMFAKAAFLAGLGSAWAAGAETWAWPLALAAAIGALLGQARLRHWRGRVGRRTSPLDLPELQTGANT